MLFCWVYYWKNNFEMHGEGNDYQGFTHSIRPDEGDVLPGVRHSMTISGYMSMKCNLLRIVTHGVAAILYIGWSIPSYGGDAVTDLPKSKAQRAYEYAMWEITKLPSYDLSQRREICASERVPALVENFIAKGGEGSHPDAPTYCTTLISEAIKRGDQDRLYKTLTLQQLDKGVAYLTKKERANFPTDFDAVIGTKDQALIDSIASATDEGKNRYVGAGGQWMRLSGALAFDAGATKATKQGKLDEPDLVLTKSQVQEAAKACYDPTQTSFSFIKDEQGFPISSVCYVAGQNFGLEAANDAAKEAKQKPATKPTRASAGR